MTSDNDNDPRARPSSGGPKGPIKDTLRAPLPRRLYTSVDVREAAGGTLSGLEVLLDGRALRTPLKRVLVVPNSTLARLIAEEWQVQGAVIDPATMPLTRLANSAIDTVADHRAAVAGEVVDYAGSDLLCYRALSPAGLVARQSEVWEPILSSVEDAIGARFVRVAGIMHAPQPDAALERVAAALVGLPDWTLAGVQLVTTLTGSAVLALGQLMTLLTPDEVWSAAHLDEDWQIAQWGRDQEAEARRASHERDFRAAAAVLAASASN